MSLEKNLNGVSHEDAWKKRLYHAYVSSGQAGQIPENITAACHFRHRAPYLRSIVRDFLPQDRSIRIADLGCGHGALLYFLKLAGYSNIAGIDVSAEQIEMAQRLGICETLQGSLNEFLAGTQPESVDVIFLMDVLEHLTRRELFTILDSVYRVLRPSGSCIIHVPNAEGIFGMRIRYGDLTHEECFTRKSLSQLFSTIGFSTVECYEDRPRMHGIVSIFRRTIWEVGTLPHRFLLAAETGEKRFILSQNMLAVAKK